MSTVPSGGILKAWDVFRGYKCAVGNKQLPYEQAAHTHEPEAQHASFIFWRARDPSFHS